MLAMLYYLDPSDKKRLTPVRETALADIGWKEEDLEHLLASHIEELVRADQLFVISQQRRMQEEADIMALDSSGQLFLFELKRWKGAEDNLLQVLRYGQRFGQYEYERLDNYFQSYRRRQGHDTSELPLAAAHATRFDLKPELEKSRFNSSQRFIVVTNGMDTATWDSIEYWRAKGLPVEALVYRIYWDQQSKRAMIDFDPYGPTPASPNVADEGLFVVNTNRTYDPNAFRDMLDNDKASAYEVRKHRVARIPKGADVCLYHTGVGVIAIGKAKSGYLTKAYYNDPDGEFYVPCKFDFKVDPEKSPEKAVPPWEINELHGTGHRFRQTVVTLPSDYATFIQERMKERAANS